MKNNLIEHKYAQALKMLCLLVCLSSLSFSCKKSIDSNESHAANFIKKFGDKSEERIAGIVKTDNGSLLLIGMNGLDRLSCIEIDLFGNIVQRHEYPLKSQIVPIVRRMPNGRIWVSNLIGTDFVVLSNRGELIEQGEFAPYQIDATRYSPVCSGSDNQFHISYSSAIFWPFTNTTQFVSMDQHGQIQNEFTLQDSFFQGNVRMAHVYEASTASFKIIGSISLGLSRLFGKEELKIFIATVPRDGGIPTYSILDTAENTEYDYMNAYALTNDGGVACVSSNQLYYATDYYDNALSEMEVFKFDINQNLDWKAELDIGALRVSPTGMVSLDNGNLLVFGHCSTADAGSAFKPFMAVLDESGNLIQHRIYAELRNSYFTDVKGLPDGGYVFSGFTGVFGNGKDKSDGFVLRTTASGDYHP